MKKRLIDKDVLAREIRKRLLPVIRDKHYDEWEEGQDSERIAILDIIDTLGIKEVDLEEELDKYYGVYRDKNGLTYDIIDKERCFDWKEDIIMANQAKVAKHFFELGLKAQKGE